MDWRLIANAPWLWFCGFLQAAIGLFQAVTFYRLAARLLTRHGGYSRPQIRAMVRGAAITAVGPVLAEILVMMTLVIAVSPAFCWQREGVGVGSVVTEVVQVSNAAIGVGQRFGEPGFDLVGFAAAVLVVNVACVGASLGAAFFTPSLGRVRDRLSGGDPRLMALIGTASSLGIFAFFAASEVKKRGGREVAVLSGALLSMFLFKLADWLHVPRLKEWALGLSVFGGTLIAYWTRG